jgi:hypothetical protein
MGKPADQGRVRVRLEQRGMRDFSLFRNSVPQGRLNLAQDASPGLDSKGRLVPQGRLEVGRGAILNKFQAVPEGLNS